MGPNLWDELTQDTLLQIDAGLTKNAALMIQMVQEGTINMAIQAAENIEDSEERKALLDPYNKIQIGVTKQLEIEGFTRILRQNITQLNASIGISFIEAELQTFFGTQVETFGRSKYATTIQFGINVSIGELTNQLAQRGEIDQLKSLAQNVGNIEWRVFSPRVESTPA